MTDTTLPPLMADDWAALRALTFDPSHTAVGMVLAAARAVALSTSHKERMPHMDALRRALLELEQPGNKASNDEIEDATAAHLRALNDGTLEIDGTNAALVSRAEEGFWISAWAWVPTGPAEDDDADQADADADPYA